MNFPKGFTKALSRDQMQRSYLNLDGNFLHPVTGMDMNKYLRKSMRQAQSDMASNLEKNRKNKLGRIEV